MSFDSGSSITQFRERQRVFESHVAEHCIPGIPLVFETSSVSLMLMKLRLR